MVDVSEPDTIDLAPTWKQDVLNHAQFTHNSTNQTAGTHEIMTSSIPVLLLGNKADKLEVLDVKQLLLVVDELWLNCTSLLRFLVNSH